jgi:hypothetical protein
MLRDLTTTMSVLALAIFPVLCTAAPVGGPSAPAYVPGPSGRGTVGLVSNCVVTLSLCVWTAIHLNVFPPGTTLRKRIWSRLAWALLGTFAPEIVLWRAITQWRVARELRDKRNELMDEAISLRTKSSSDPNLVNESRVSSPWELEHGFLVVMGGMGITFPEDRDPEMLNAGCTITPSGA